MALAPASSRYAHSSIHQDNPAISNMQLNQKITERPSPKTPQGKIEPVWPEHFPPGCPGDRGAETSGMIFQFVRTNPATELDIRSAMETGKHELKCACLRSSLSCYINIEHIAEVKKCGGYWAQCHIASCNVRPEMGRIMQTGSRNHHSLWLKKESLSIYLCRLEVQG